MAKTTVLYFVEDNGVMVSFDDVSEDRTYHSFVGFHRDWWAEMGKPSKVMVTFEADH